MWVNLKKTVKKGYLFKAESLEGQGHLTYSIQIIKYSKKNVSILHRCAAKAVYIRFQVSFRANKMTLKYIK